MTNIKKVSELTRVSLDRPPEKCDSLNLSAKQTNDAFEYSLKVVGRIKAACSGWQYTWPDESIELVYVNTLFIEFKKSGITSAKSINDTIEDLQRNKVIYPPSAIEFVDQVIKHQFKTFNAPEAEVAYIEACKKGFYTKNSSWSHIAIKETADRVGWYNLKTKRQDEVFPLFKGYYDAVKKEIERGAIFIHEEPVIEDLLRIEFKHTDETKKRSVAGIQKLKDILKQNAELLIE